MSHNDTGRKRPQRDRLENYHEGTRTIRLALDYYCLNRVIPRESDVSDMPPGWEYERPVDIRDGIEAVFGESISKGSAFAAWERAGANFDIPYAINLLQERRDELVRLAFNDRILELVADNGLSSAEAVDYYATEELGMNQSEWARRKEKLQQGVSKNVRKARAKLGE
jgi:hypothetical protein